MRLGEVVRRRVGHAHADHAALAVHEVARVHLDRSAAADDDDPPVHREGGHVVAQVDVREQLDDEIEAEAAGDLVGGLQVARRAVVERLDRAVVGDELAAGVAAGRPRDPQAGGDGELDGGEADCAARAVHEHAFAGDRPGALEQRAIGGRVRRAECRSLGERQLVGSGCT